MKQLSQEQNIAPHVEPKQTQQPTFFKHILNRLITPGAEAGSLLLSTGLGMMVGVIFGSLAFPAIGTGIGAACGTLLGSSLGLGIIGSRRQLTASILGRTFGGVGMITATTSSFAVLGALAGTFFLPGIGTAMGAGIGAGFGGAAGLGITGYLQGIQSKTNVGKLLGLGLTSVSTLSIMTGIGALIGGVVFPGIGAGAGAGLGALAGILVTVGPIACILGVEGMIKLLNKAASTQNTAKPVACQTTPAPNTYSKTTPKLSKHPRPTNSPHKTDNASADKQEKSTQTLFIRHNPVAPSPENKPSQPVQCRL